MAESIKKPELKEAIPKRFSKWLLALLKDPDLNEGEPKPDAFWGASPFHKISRDIDFEHDSRDMVNKKLEKVFEESRNDELLAIARADLKLTKESNQKNLIILHRTQLVSIAALIVAIFAVIFH